MGLWSDIWKRQSEDWTYVELEEHQAEDPIPVEPVDPNTAYLNVVLRSMRIVHVRKALSRFYGTVHSWISVPHMGDGSAEFQVIATPAELRDADASNLDRVISLDQRLLGPVPYRGGDIGLELGLFSIKSADLAGPFLDVLEGLSEAAGVSFVSAAMPFVGPIRRGIDSLAGADQDSTLEIGHARDITSARTGYFAILRAPRGTVAASGLHLAADRRLEVDGAAIVDYPYMVWSVEKSSQRPDWFSVPELLRSYGDLTTSIRSGNQENVTDSLAGFRRAALVSPDLLFADASAIVKTVEAEVAEIMKAPQAAAELTSELDLPSLEDIRVEFG